MGFYNKGEKWNREAEELSTHQPTKSDPVKECQDEIKEYKESFNDSEILNWINEHLDSFVETLQENENGESLYAMGWIDDEGISHTTKGTNIRNCVVNAMAGEKV